MGSGERGFEAASSLDADRPCQAPLTDADMAAFINSPTPAGGGRSATTDEFVVEMQ